jgi:hypothetical protein
MSAAPLCQDCRATLCIGDGAVGGIFTVIIGQALGWSA